MATKEAAINVWKNADAVCFDVDSTVCCDEGLDELAKYCGVADKVKEWTNKAMGGSVSFRESFRSRLEIVKPSTQTMKSFVESHPVQLSPSVKELVNKLHESGCNVYLVSGGMVEIIEPVAKLLNVPLSNVFANRLKYYFNGEYAGFDEDCPTSESGGKPRVIKELKQKFGYKKVVMIGDGVTDMEASPPADAFVGYGGNVVRPKVEENSAWFVTDFKEMMDEL
nr:phosphoserine phosphatase-like [Ciona intestinalis]XP_004227312.1 phosphoserine phosphatase-like [Ciona intestinalis]|eukprot:XP_002119347.1 phosphoserine phosphatase-like [Ciona intestinalis]